MPEFLCGVRLPGTHARCQLEPGHRGLHTATLLWPEPDPDDAPTMKLPPIRDRILPPPPPPVVRDLTDRAELLRQMAAELARELGELGEDPEDADESRPRCGLALVLPYGNIYCERREGHPGDHAAGRRGTDTWREW